MRQQVVDREAEKIYRLVRDKLFPGVPYAPAHIGEPGVHHNDCPCMECWAAEDEVEALTDPCKAAPCAAPSSASFSQRASSKPPG